MANACIAVWHFHHVNAVSYGNEPLWQAAWHHAWHMARFADRAARDAIRYYLKTDHKWSVVNYDCGFAQN